MVKQVKGPLSPTALDIETAAKMLNVEPSIVRKHVASGAPTNADGTINLVHYAAWLVAEEAGRGD